MRTYLIRELNLKLVQLLNIYFAEINCMHCAVGTNKGAGREIAHYWLAEILLFRCLQCLLHVCIYV